MANLSDFKHNPRSFRYGILDVPGNSHEEIMEKYRRVVEMLCYKFISQSEPAELESFLPTSPPRRAKGRRYELASQASLPR